MTNLRLRYNGLRTTLGAALTNSGTTITFAAALTHNGGTSVPGIAGGDFIMLALIDPLTGGLREIVKLTAYTAGATTGTIARAQEGTTGIAHPIGTIVANNPTVADFGQWTAWVPTITAETGTFTNATGSGWYLDMGDVVFYHLTITITTVGTAAGGVRFPPPSPTTFSANAYTIGHGRESALTGHGLTVSRISASVAHVVKYDNSSIIAAGRVVNVAGHYMKG